MLRHLRIQNFKAWKDTGNIELAPITVFLGTNSSGKSSIAQFLMMLKQTVEYADPSMTLFTGDDKSAVDVGIPSQMLYGHDMSQSLRFFYDWDINMPFRFSFDSKWGNSLEKELPKDEQSFFVGTTAGFTSSIEVINKFTQTLGVENFIYDVVHNGYPAFSVEMKRANMLGKQAYEVLTNNITPLPSTPSDMPVLPVKFYAFSEGAFAHYNIPAVRTLQVLHYGLFSSIYYIGPLRAKPHRFYSWIGNMLADVGSDGSNAIFALIAANAAFKQFELKNVEKNQYNNFSISSIVAEMLKNMELIEEFKLTPLNGELRHYEVAVRTKGSSVWAHLPDVGFGISQVLPILVELFSVPIGSIILMEQPELHLHPSAQAALADVMIDAIRARENGQDRNIQLLIETHSEHFLRRLQRRIAEGVIDEKTVRGYFADTSETPFQLRPLEIDTYGNILNWPENFFGDIGNDIYLQADAALERKINGMRKKSENH